ncbi:hypothetical protein NLG97_g7475 [Lecanicillium saksenae]|uniref:Uncharacterized protein n=1 Tax=Lecanicillium saksenae TaxID=468837 RepID=A0ACC1QLS1_9HYPO|nr:hypothetical protein NLG97_g7475 [Lecanicillium saksenae]
MRFATLSTVILANAIGALALEGLAESVKDFPKCSYSAFKKALDKEGCDVKNVGSGTFDCLCKHLESIVVSVSMSRLDANCQASMSTSPQREALVNKSFLTCM